MKKQELIELLKKGSKIWNEWKMEEPYLQPRLDLRGADLQGIDLRGADLIRTDLRETNLSFADLTDAFLVESDLTDANLHGAKCSVYRGR